MTKKFEQPTSGSGAGSGPKRRAKHEGRQVKRDEATARQGKRAGRTDAEQVKVLAERGHGECREAKRLGR